MPFDALARPAALEIDPPAARPTSSSDPAADLAAAAARGAVRRLRRLRRAHRAVGGLLRLRLGRRPTAARRIALGAATIWGLGLFFFGGLWLAASALGAGWAWWVVQPDSPLSD